jgi:lysozyme
VKTNAAGLELIKKAEGCRLEAYADPATGGVPWTIGYGHTRDPFTGQLDVKPRDKLLSEHQAEELLRVDLDVRYEPAVTRCLAGYEVTENQFSALVSFVYNLGEASLQRSQLLKKLKAGDEQGAADEFGKWVYAAGYVMPGLVGRRTAEMELFLR